MNSILREEFVKNFNLEMVATDLMDLIDKDKLENYMLNEFKENFTYGEVYDLFKNYMNEEDLKDFLEQMGHDFVDLDNLEDDEKDNYF